ncbi:MAG: hypothetical protein E7165_03610 [Firmicutes bacterium]|nr:hypothetical protein [Bacillota bacterium]
MVTAEAGTKKIYNIKVNRLQENEKLSNNNYLSILEIDGYDINFNKETLEYTISIKDEDSLKITTKTEGNAKVSIEGNNDLKNGSIIKITVTAEDDTTRNYIINIKSNRNNILIITLLGIVLISVIVVVMFVFKKNK